MSEIVLINPPDQKISEHGKVDSDQSYSPPIGIAGMAALLEKEGYDVTAYDFYYQPWDEVKKILIKEAPLIYAISCYTDQRGAVYKLINLIRSFDTEGLIVLGGPHPTFLYEQLLRNFSVDVAVIGEGEQTLLELVAAYYKKESYSNVAGIAYKEKGNVIKTKPRSLIKNLDSLPFPDYRYFEHIEYAHRYWLEGMEALGRPATELDWIAVIGSRGCPFNCNFCSTPQVLGRGWRSRSPRHFVDEIEALYKKYKFEFFDFSDDIFSANQKWVIEVCREILSRKDMKIAWNCCTRVDCISEEMLGYMVQAGCVLLSFGLESFSPRILKTLNKKTVTEQVARAYAMTHDAGIYSEMLIIVGSPGETDESIGETVEFARKVKPLLISPNILTIYPGTEFYRQACADGFMSDEYWLSDKPAPYDTREHKLETLKGWYETLRVLDFHSRPAPPEYTRV